MYGTCVEARVRDEIARRTQGLRCGPLLTTGLARILDDK